MIQFLTVLLWLRCTRSVFINSSHAGTVPRDAWYLHHVGSNNNIQLLIENKLKKKKKNTTPLKSTNLENKIKAKYTALSNSSKAKNTALSNSSKLQLSIFRKRQSRCQCGLTRTTSRGRHLNQYLSLASAWIYNYLRNQCLSSLKLWVRTLFMARCTRYNIMW